MSNTVLLVSVVIAVSSAANAADVTNCWGAGNTVEQNECFIAEFEKSDKELNNTYQRLIRLVRNHGEDWVNDLRLAQRRWIEFRDLNCVFYGNYMKGGTGVGQYYGDCKLRMTSEREKELQVMVKELAERGYQEMATPNKPLEPTR